MKMLVLRVTPTSAPLGTWWVEGDTIMENAPTEDPALDIAREVLANKAPDATWEEMFDTVAQMSPRAYGVWELHEGRDTATLQRRVRG